VRDFGLCSGLLVWELARVLRGRSMHGIGLSMRQMCK
jgi:hypothetical protein